MNNKNVHTVIYGSVLTYRGLEFAKYISTYREMNREWPMIVKYVCWAEMGGVKIDEAAN